MKKTAHYASYHERIFNPELRKDTVFHSVRLVNALRQNDKSIYAIVGTGTSGILGALVAEKCDMDFVYVRRENEKPHDFRRVCGNIAPGKFLFFDDLIDSGKTLVHVLKSIDQERENLPDNCETPTIAAAVCYDTTYPKNNVWSHTYSDSCYLWNHDYLYYKKQYPYIRGYSVQYFSRNNLPKFV